MPVISIFTEDVQSLATAFREGRLPRGTVTTYASIARCLGIRPAIVLDVVKACSKIELPTHRIVPTGGLLGTHYPLQHARQLVAEGHRLTTLSKHRVKLQNFRDHWADGLPAAEIA